MGPAGTNALAWGRRGVERIEGGGLCGRSGEFRGALDGRTQMGVIITTSSYSKDAVKEAERDGAFQINLINGIELCELLKQYKLGVSTEISEIVSIEPDFFKSLEQ